MPLTLVEINSLIAAIGVKIPEDILQQKAKAEEFEQRRKKITGEAGAKPAEWHLKAKHDSALKAADDAAGKKQFDPALKQLDECEQLLKQPDLAPEVVAALKQAEERKKACDAEIARVKALESPVANDIKAALEAASQALKDFDPKTAGQRLTEIEQSVKAYATRKAAADAAAAKAQEIEQAKLKARVDELKKQFDAGLAEIKKLVDTIFETTLRQPQAETLEKLTARGTAATKLDPLARQEAELTELSKEIAPLKAAAEKAAAESKALIAARAVIAGLKAQAEKELKDADAAVKAIGEPTFAAPEAQKLEALTKKQTATAGLSDLGQQEKDFKALVVEIVALKKDAAAAKVNADELKATKLRVTQKLAAVDTALTDLQNVVSGIKEQVLKDELTPQITPLTQERTRIGTLTVPADQEAALLKLETDIANVKKDADNNVLWDKWLKDTWENESEITKGWVDSLKEEAAKKVLLAEFEALQQEKANFLAAGDYSSIETKSYPKLDDIYDAAHRISNRGPEVDMELHKIGNLLVAITKEISDPTITDPIHADLEALEAKKKKSWPGGNSAKDILSKIDDFDADVQALREDAEDARGDFVGGDLAHRAKEIQWIESSMADIRHQISNFEKMDWEEAAKLPPEQSRPLLKLKTDLEAAQKTFKALQPRLKKVLPYAKRNPTKSDPQALGKEVVALRKEVAAVLDTVLRRMAKIAILTDVAGIDKQIAAMPDHADDPSDLAKCKALIEARFGIKIEIGEDFHARSLPRIGKMLARVPEWQAKQAKKAPDGTAVEKSLKKLTYQTEPKAKGNYYSSSRKTIGLQGMTEKGKDDEHRLTADSGKVVKTSYFDFTTLHEIGHAVDDRIKFMSSRMEKSGFGNWKKESYQTVLNAFLPTLVADCSGGAKKAQAADLEAMLTDLIKTGECKKPANATDKLGSLFDEWGEIEKHGVVAKCKQGLHTKSDPWDKGKAHAEAVEMGGRVYHEAYAGDWYSYALADRASTGVTTYQWRAPGEWFAEIYALYYLNKLSRSHPMSGWFRNAAKSEAKARKV